MKKLMLAALAAMTLSVGVASAQELINNVNNHLPSPEYSYSVAGG
ncbi:MAG TPA: hypothetical protein VME47_20585 [Acetobacteraceae bacterium]|nr:hypothetical protein [Acetobacteraceae bacterium]